MLKQSRKVLLSSMLAFIMLFSNTSFVFAEETTEVEKTEIVEKVTELEVEKVDEVIKEVEEVKEVEKIQTETKDLEPMSIMPFAASSGGTRIVEMQRHSTFTERGSHWTDWQTLTTQSGSFAIIAIRHGNTYLFDMLNNRCMTLGDKDGNPAGYVSKYGEIDETTEYYNLNIEQISNGRGFLVRTQSKNGSYDNEIRIGITIFE